MGIVTKKEVELQKDALTDRKAVYRLLQAFIRLSEIGGRTEEQEKELNEI